MDRVTTFCFLASYALALALELLHLWIGRPFVRALALVAGAAGLVAQTIYLYLHQPPLILQFGWMLFVAWILAVFYLSGIQHGNEAIDVIRSSYSTPHEEPFANMHAEGGDAFHSRHSSSATCLLSR